MAQAYMYGILDCSRSPTLYEHVARLAPHGASCLFAGDLAEEVARVSPYLVELAPNDPLSRDWRTQGWGQAWGILISSRADLPTLRQRLRRYTTARLPDGGGPMLFRFWDPRVFRVYMPLVEPQELPGWFEAADRYIAETEDGRGSLRYAYNGAALSVEQGPPPGR
jgi:hypothetical protein